MKKQILLLTASFLTYTVIVAKSPIRKRGYAAIKFGVGIPSSNFADKTFSHTSSGFAQAGPCFDLNVAYKVVKYVGFAGMIRTNYYFMDQHALAKEYAKANPGYNVTVSYPLSFGGMYMAGLFASFPLDPEEKVSLDARALGGFGYLVLPKMKVSGSDIQTGESFSTERDLAFAFSPAYLLGLGLRYNMGRFMAILLNVDYTGANFSVHGQETSYSSTQGGDFSTRNSYKIPYGCVNITAGAAFRFGREKTPAIQAD